ncbi:MAG: hypothetical protein COA78_30265 [Blastopirellula sp.]|nr:MAG: hypothetical protein COA78_30265 [Blastopirellula sp.]
MRLIVTVGAGIAGTVPVSQPQAAVPHSLQPVLTMFHLYSQLGHLYSTFLSSRTEITFPLCGVQHFCHGKVTLGMQMSLQTTLKQVFVLSVFTSSGTQVLPQALHLTLEHALVPHALVLVQPQLAVVGAALIIAFGNINSAMAIARQMVFIERLLGFIFDCYLIIMFAVRNPP